jgi:small-conductance mechanosensitive channel
MDNFLEHILWGNSIKVWLVAIGIIMVSLIMARLFQSIGIARIKKFSEKTRSTVDNFLVSIIQRSVMPFLYILAVYFGLQYLWLEPRIGQILHVALLFVSVFFVIRIITDIIAYLFQRFLEKRAGEPTEARQARGILIIIKIIIWSIGLLFLIDNLGYNITTIITGLGIGGIAIALAAQAVLADIFSYLVIFFDKPFETGDFIIIGDKMGVVEYIGIKTTRIRALGGEQLIVANTDLTNSRVQNYKRMQRRRVLFSIGVIYETGTEKLRRIPGIIKEIIAGQANVKFDRAHFAGFGDFSLNFEIVYYLESADYNLYMDVQEIINLEICQAFEKENIEFAYPTQKLLLYGQPENSERLN